MNPAVKTIIKNQVRINRRGIPVQASWLASVATVFITAAGLTLSLGAKAESSHQEDTKHHHAVQSSETMAHEHQHKSAKPVDTVRATGIIKAVLLGKHQLKVLHDPIKEWDMVGMQMKFHVSTAIDIQHLKPEQRITFTLRNEGLSRFVLTELIAD
jgi:Cu/Ag efflux protein CusF